MQRFTLSVLVENKFGVLARIASLFSARGFNIDSLAVGEIRMCIYWPASMKGDLGLASKGPNSSCKIGDKVPGETRLYGVTAVFPVTEAAAKKWEDAPWS